MAASPVYVIVKILQDVAECVASLKNQFDENDKYPISDESVTLQRFCAKLEFLLLHEIKEKSSVLGGKKGYWDYFCQCLSSSRKQPHDGIRFVKLKSELKTSQGRGRAFIRFCLSHGCLADTLQFCFDQTKTTSDWYNEKAVPCNKERWSSLVSALYELNDIHFVLAPDCYGLDVSWPTFSRSTSFDNRLSWQPPSRSISVTSLNSQPETAATYQMEEQKESSELEQKIYELCQAEADLYESRQRNVEMLKKEARLLKEIEELKTAVDKSTNDATKKVEQIEEEYASKVELLTIQHTSREQYFKEAEIVSRDKISSLESENLELQSQVYDLSKMLEEMRASNIEKEKQFQESFEILHVEKENCQSELMKINENFLNSSGVITFMKEKVTDLSSKLLEMEENAKIIEKEKEELGLKLSNVELTSQDMKNLIFDLNGDNNKMKEEMEDLKEQLNVKNGHITDLQSTCAKLLNEKTSMESNIEELYKTITDKNLELDTLRNQAPVEYQDIDVQKEELTMKISDMEAVNKHLREDMKNLVESMQLGNESDKKKDVVSRMNSEMQKLIDSKRNELEEVNSKLSTFEQYGILLAPLISHHEIMINQLYQNIDILSNVSQKLKSEMKTLALAMQRLANCSNSQLDFPSLNESSIVSNPTNQTATNLFDFSVPTNNNFPLVNSMHSLVTTLRSISLKKEDIETVIKSCQALCFDMNNFAEERERKLMAKTIKLRHSKNIVATLVNEHKKMQSAEAILKYELQEKRKLLTRLRHQLETTHDEWSRVRRQNLESEEWQSLRDDFANRRKQASEESGFVDERATEENVSEGSEASSNPSALESVPENEYKDDDPSSVASSERSNSVPCEGAVGNSETTSSQVENGETKPRTRLEILEEQCNILYTSLLNSSKKSEKLEQRLQAILGHHEDVSVSSEDSGACAANSEAALVSEASDFLVEDIEGSDVITLEEDEADTTCSEASNSSTVPVWNQEEIQTSTYSQSYEFHINGDILDTNLRGTSPDEEPSHSLRKKALENLVSKFKNERKIHESKENELKIEIERLEKCNIELENKVAELQIKNISVSSQENDFRKRAEYIFRQERNSFVNKIQQLSTECNELVGIVDELKKELESKEEELEKTAQDVIKIRQQFAEKEISLNEKISCLQFNISTDTLKFEKTLQSYSAHEKTIAEMTDKIDQQEQLIHILEESLTEIKDERDSEANHWRTELDELNISLATRDEECSVLGENLQEMKGQFHELETFNKQLEEQAVKVELSYQAKVEALDEELALYKVDYEEMKSQIIKLTQDKDSLWKKSEKLSQICATPSTDRWVPDSEVDDCMKCNAQFSFTLRKHHCRICGQIFCHNCTSHWILTAASSRRSRVCDECYVQHEGRRSSLKESLNLESQPISRPIFGNRSKRSSIETVSVDSLPNSNFEPSSCREASENMDIHPSSTPKKPIDVENEKAEETACRLDFDVISDEEITLSLSNCSPYSPDASPSNQGLYPEMPVSVTRTVQDILAAGSEGLSTDVWVNAGCSYDVPLLIEEQGVVLKYEFSSSPKSIVFAVLFKEAKCENGENEILFKPFKVSANLQPVTGQVTVKEPGMYTLIFNNSFSKYLAKKVTYNLKIVTAAENFSDNAQS